MRKFKITFVAVALVLCGLLAAVTALGSELKAGQPIPPAEKFVIPPWDGMNVSLDVLVNGRPARLISHEGRLYLPVTRYGTGYELRVVNRGMWRITAVASVDGLSVLTKEPASESQPGYLVDPGVCMVIKGWRRDEDTVSAFTFEDRESSFAFRLGERDKIGEIKVIAIEEAQINPRYIEKKGTPIAAKRAEFGVGGTGTGWGRDINSSVVAVPFERGKNKRTITIYYDTADALRRMSVPVDSLLAEPGAGDGK